MTSKHLIIYVLSAISLLFNSNAHAYCFEEAGQLYGINPLVLRSIAGVESSNKPDAVGKNTNGSYDVGLMQINTIWKSTLGLERWKHLGDACYNTKTGAWILAACISKYGYNWRAVGCYNSQTPEKSEIYAKKIFEKLERLKSGKEPQPMDKDMEAVLTAHVEEVVAAKQEGRKVPKKKVLKFVPYTRLPKAKLHHPPPAPAGEPSAPVPVPW
ncbi:MAG: lytic transglycosylase domain-containing protein [Trichlorobacter sp.]|uniref:lytic transglycosylase domain-containing protein n=1 Tax=Trichlorobacter sp. TaxID=2911007 RepID=UPI002569891E|nr:lytic transglycosylase domain-containing protein [Trichlorobacter sp.]MDK9718355.1 lytic transglycosylase domain-containing protein [Trichlorobacter sp.]